MSTPWYFGIFIMGIVISGILARKYTWWGTQIVLTITGALSLFFIIVGVYPANIENPLPQPLSFFVFPAISLIIMGLVIRYIPKSKQKRKNTE